MEDRHRMTAELYCKVSSLGYNHSVASGAYAPSRRQNVGWCFLNRKGHEFNPTVLMRQQRCDLAKYHRTTILPSGLVFRSYSYVLTLSKERAEEVFLVTSRDEVPMNLTCQRGHPSATPLLQFVTR